jgi:hypothetical protein
VRFLSRHNRTSLGRCWMLQAMGYVSCRRFGWNSCQGWPTLHFGQRPAKRHFARWRLFACLSGKPQVRHRRCGRGRPGRGAHPRHHGRADHVERVRFRLIINARRCRSFKR